MTGGQNLGYWMIKQREKRNWSLERLAEETGIPKTTLHSIEAGKVAEPRGHTLSAIAYAFDEPVTALHVILGHKINVPKSKADELAAIEESLEVLAEMRDEIAGDLAAATAALSRLRRATPAVAPAGVPRTRPGSRSEPDRA